MTDTQGRTGPITRAAFSLERQVADEQIEQAAEQRDLQRFREMRRAALYDISQASKSLHANLVEAKRDIDKALEAMAAGDQVRAATSSGGGGPLGAQLSFELARNTERVNVAIGTAVQLGIHVDLIQEKYTR